MLNAKNLVLCLNGITVDYICFGSGPKKLIILPGLGDGLRTVKGSALPMALLYKDFGRDYTVYAFSRRNELHNGISTRDMAADIALAMDELGIEKAHILGVSMGGMIAQFLAIDYPAKVDKLILAVTCSQPNHVIEKAISEWVNSAKHSDHRAFMDLNLKYIYSDRYYRSNKWTVPFVAALTKPKSYERFFILAEACLKHDAYELLPEIEADTLVVGGEKDICLGGDASREIHSQIHDSQLKMYENWGHGLYEEEKGFNVLVLSFLRG